MIVRKTWVLLVLLMLGALASGIQAQPVISGITRSGVDPTNANTLNWNVSFSEPVTGVTAANFTAVPVGTTFTSISSVTAAPGNQTWFVAVAGVDGDGTLGLDLSNPAGITGASGALASTATGEVYTVDNTRPQVVSITRLYPSPTNATAVNFQITFSEPIFGLTASNLAPGGTLTGSVTNVSATADPVVWTASIVGIFGSGTIGLDITDISFITDLAGNMLPSDYTGSEQYIIDQDGPNYVCITRLDPSPTSATIVRFMVEFDEPAAGVQPSNFAINAVNLTGVISSVVAEGDGTTWTLTVSDLDGTGPLLTVDLVDPSGITDIYGNPTTSIGPGCEHYEVDLVSPEVVAINLVDPNPSPSDTRTFLVVFSEPVTSATLSDFSLILTGSATGVVSETTTSANLTSVTVSNITGAGSICLVVESPSTITDLIGNPLINIPVVSGCYIKCLDYAPITGYMPADGETTATTASHLYWTAPENDLLFHVYFDGTYAGSTTDTQFMIPEQPMTPGLHSYMIDINGSCTSSPLVQFNALDRPDLIAPPDGHESCRSPRVFEWEPVDGATTYTLYVNGFLRDVTTETLSNNTIPYPVGTYIWYVRAENDHGFTQSETWTFYVTPDEPVPPTIYKTDGTIYSMIEGPGNIVYIGGEFTRVQNPNLTWVDQPNLAAINKVTGYVISGWDPAVNGAVYTLEPSGGTMYIGGNFTKFSDESRTRVAALPMDNVTTVPTVFAPHANGPVRAMEVVGSRLYYGGDFTRVGVETFNFATPGIPAVRLAMADVTTDTVVMPVGTLNPNAIVRDLLFDGSHMYIAGVFSQIGSQSIRGLARAERTITGSLVLDETFNQEIDLYVHTMLRLGNRLYLGGSFNSIKKKERLNAAAIDLGDDETSPSLLAWSPRPNASVESMDTTRCGSTIYLGGTFTSVNLEQATYAAGVDASGGYLQTCTFHTNRPVYSVIASPKFATSPNRVLLGGLTSGPGN